MSQFENGYSVRTERYRYTEWGEKGAEGNELYDHQTDPGEMKNLAGEAGQEETVSELKKLLEERIAGATKKPKGLTQIQFENRRRVR